jgi:hypothetical protein
MNIHRSKDKKNEIVSHQLFSTTTFRTPCKIWDCILWTWCQVLWTTRRRPFASWATHREWVGAEWRRSETRSGRRWTGRRLRLRWRPRRANRSPRPGIDSRRFRTNKLRLEGRRFEGTLYWRFDLKKNNLKIVRKNDWVSKKLLSNEQLLLFVFLHFLQAKRFLSFPK